MAAAMDLVASYEVEARFSMRAVNQDVQHRAALAKHTDAPAHHCTSRLLIAWPELPQP